MDCSRRKALQLLSAAGCIGTGAGCLSPGSLDAYALIGSEFNISSIGPPFLWSDLTAIEATTRVDFTTEIKRQYISTLFETGSVTVQQWPLVWRSQWGKESRPRPTFLNREKGFYQVRISDEQLIEQNRWHVALERIQDEPPDDAIVETTPFELSDQDKRIVQAALDAVYAGHDGFLGDPEFDELQTVEYHYHLNAEESELIPSPPFTFLKYNNEYFRVITKQEPVTVPEWTYTISEIATTREEFNDYAEEAILEHDLNSKNLSDPAHDVLDKAISEDPGVRYEEGTPLSEKLTEVLIALGIEDDLQPIDSYEERVDFRDVVVEYHDSTYRFSLIITPQN